MAVVIPFVKDIEFEYGRTDSVSPLVRRVIANNPGPFTFTGTGTYIIGQGEVAVIDPGPLLDAHVDAILAGLASGERITHILITHTHGDHSPAAAPLKEKTGAKTYGYGAHGASAHLGDGAKGVMLDEGGDRGFEPDVSVRHGDVIEGSGWTMECVFTPGHTSNHMCYALREEKALFTGDHIMGWSTSVIGPPDGDMQAYMDSLDLLLTRDDEVYWPTHGAPVREPKPFVEAFAAHRLDRESQIMACLNNGMFEIQAMVAQMYTAVDSRLHPAAARSVFAHLVRMVHDGRVGCSDDKPQVSSTYFLP